MPEPPPETSQSKVKEVEKSERNTNEKTLQTSGDHFFRLDSEMYEVLRSKAARDDYEKCVNYLQILRRYLFFREEAILVGVPKIHARKACLLLRHWNNTGTITIDERVIPRSNITELIIDALNKKSQDEGLLVAWNLQNFSTLLKHREI